MIDIGKKSKILVTYKTSPYDYSKDKVKDIINKFSKKYKIAKELVSVEPYFIMQDAQGNDITVSTELFNNIQDPNFQQHLFSEYIALNGIEGVDFDYIKKIDAEINAKVDFDSFDKLRRYEIKWIKWDNFLSYGEGNFFDFRQLNGLTLLNGEPANQSGKTTFAIDLLHFLLYGKTDKADTQDKIFNKYIPEATTLTVEGCLNIEGADYIIKRTLSRPQLKKRTSKSKTTQKVEYYRVIGDALEELIDDVDNKKDENSIKTNKVIKETIGNESDFDLAVCATGKNLDDLIDKKNTERGRILSRWIGLLPVENKEMIAKEKYNNEIKPYLLSNKYSETDLLAQREQLLSQIEYLRQEITKYEKNNETIDIKIASEEEIKKTLMMELRTIDTNVSRIDITTLDEMREKITNRGIELKNKINGIETQIASIDIGSFSEDEYEALVQKKIDLTSQLTVHKNNFFHLGQQRHELEKGEYCPTCGRKLDNVDNSSKIKEILSQELKLQELIGCVAAEISSIDNRLLSMKTSRENFNLKSKLKIDKASFEVQIEQLRNELREKNQMKKEYEENKQAIEKNNQLNQRINTIEFNLSNYRNTKEANVAFITNLQNEVSNCDKSIKDIENAVNKLKEEEKTVKHWKIYLELVGKNGITKMVLRKALPIINAQMVNLLLDVCDFDVEITISDKNEVNFNIIKDGVKSDISSGSGFEKTAAALALRFVLAKNSVLPKLNYVVLDEVLSRVATENLDNISLILDRVKKDYSCIIIVTHNEYFKEKANKVVTVKKNKDISYLTLK